MAALIASVVILTNADSLSLIFESGLLIIFSVRTGENLLFIERLTDFELVRKRLVVNDVDGPFGGKDLLDGLEVDEAAVGLPRVEDGLLDRVGEGRVGEQARGGVVKVHENA